MSKKMSKAKKAGVVTTLLTIIAIFGGFLFTSGLLGGSEAITIFAPHNLTIGKTAQFALFLQSGNVNPSYGTAFGAISYARGGCLPTSSAQTLSVNVYINGVMVENVTANTAPSTDINQISSATGIPITTGPSTGSGWVNPGLNPWPSSPYCTSYCRYPVSQSGAWASTGNGGSRWYLFNYTPTMNGSSYQIQVQSTCADSFNTYNGTMSAARTTITAFSGTIPVNAATSLTGPGSNPPAFSFTAIVPWLQAQISYLLSIFTAYFNAPLFFTGGVNQTQNVSYVNQQISKTVSISIPANLQSTPYTIGASRLVSTSCAGYIYENVTKAYVYQGTPINATTSSYSTTLMYTPTDASVYLFGISCETSNSTFTTTWSAWSPITPVLNTYQAQDVLNQGASLQPPTTQAPTFSWASVTAWLAGVWNSITSWLHSIGL